MNAPRRHHPAALMNGLSDLLVVARPDRVARAPQLGRISRQEGVQVHHFQSSVPQPLSEPDAPADAGIVDVLIGTARVEHDEGQHGTVGPAAPEAVAERAARGEQRGAVHTRPMIFGAGGTGTTAFTALFHLSADGLAKLALRGRQISGLEAGKPVKAVKAVTATSI